MSTWNLTTLLVLWQEKFTDSEASYYLYILLHWHQFQLPILPIKEIFLNQTNIHLENLSADKTLWAQINSWQGLNHTEITPRDDIYKQVYKLAPQLWASWFQMLNPHRPSPTFLSFQQLPFCPLLWAHTRRKSMCRRTYVYTPETKNASQDIQKFPQHQQCWMHLEFEKQASIVKAEVTCLFEILTQFSTACVPEP